MVIFLTILLKLGIAVFFSLYSFRNSDRNDEIIFGHFKIISLCDQKNSDCSTHEIFMVCFFSLGFISKRQQWCMSSRWLCFVSVSPAASISFRFFHYFSVFFSFLFLRACRTQYEDKIVRLENEVERLRSQLRERHDATRMAEQREATLMEEVKVSGFHRIGL